MPVIPGVQLAALILSEYKTNWGCEADPQEIGLVDAGFLRPVLPKKAKF